jgi:hypothetical protein
MKKNLLIIGILFSFSASAQLFWTEDFGTGCNSATQASGYTGVNGTWTVASTGTNDTYADVWYVSAKASNNGVGNCVTGCAISTNQTLHVGNADLSAFGVGPDSAATYLTGLLCGSFSICSTTNKRAESPVINCSAYSGISIDFLYIEGGEASDDDARLMYYDGITWTQLDALAKTTVCASTSGILTAYSGVLPTSANNNPNVKIGFSWTNDNDAVGSDPSFAVDMIRLTASPTAVGAVSADADVTVYSSGSLITIVSSQEVKNVSVVDVTGRNVSYSYAGNIIDMGGNAGGVYFLRAVVNGSVVTRKVFIE